MSTCVDAGSDDELLGCDRLTGSQLQEKSGPVPDDVFHQFRNNFAAEVDSDLLVGFDKLTRV